MLTIMLGLALAPGVSGPIRASASTAVLTGVQVLDDRLDPIDAAIVRLRAGSQESVVLTDPEGQTPWVSLDPSSGVEVTLGEQSTANGVLLGMIETVSLPLQIDPSLDAFLTGISRTQTLAVPVLVKGNPGGQTGSSLFPPSGDYPHWRIALPPGSDLRFSMYAASLLDSESIDQFMTYRGQAVDPSLGYVRGLDFVVPGVQLGAQGMAIGMDLLGDLPSGVTVDAYNFTPDFPFLVPSGPPLQVSVLTVTNGIVYMGVTGGVAPGHLTLLARPSSGPPGTTQLLQDNPPNIVIPPNAGNGVQYVMCEDRALSAESACRGTARDPLAGSAFITDCLPPTPNTPPNWTCNPKAPASNHCGSATPGQKDCKLKKWRTPVVCRDPGTGFASTTVRTEKWKVKFELKTSDGLPLSSGGGFEYGKDSTTNTTDNWTAGPGAYGLGECTRFYKFVMVCAQGFTRMVDDFEYGPFGIEVLPCSFPIVFMEGCSDTLLSQSTCSRTP